MSIIDFVLIVSCVQISAIYAAPMMQLKPFQRFLIQQQQHSLQQQLLELQALRQLETLPSQLPLNNPVQPLLFFIPDVPMNMDQTGEQAFNEKNDNGLKLRDNTKTDGDSDSVTVDAEPLPILEEQKAVLVFPNGRFSIGGIISAIPFLPIEINVPDTISWAYNGIANGIAGIISIIGQRLPFRKPSDTPAEASLKSTINNLRMRNQNEIPKPIVMIPLGGIKPILPVQL